MHMCSVCLPEQVDRVKKQLRETRDRESGIGEDGLPPGEDGETKEQASKLG